MLEKFAVYLKDINESIESIENFIEEMTQEQFEDDDKTSSAVIRKLEIIGEASKYIPKVIRNKYTEIPWKEMAGMRDKLIHAYSKVDFKLVWMTIKHRIPEIKPLLKKILDELSD